ncbi:MAG: hypothetical protein GDA39_07160 [Hyphomonadaceae bacterium]|nr:hypothetical protein [Hyphomonadaceae bacterium]MBC6412659.1 hypothetical protein [Hyphomonadaceae bacterium]
MQRFVLTGLVVLVLGCDSVDRVQSSESGHTYQVYFLGGQSNMDGYGYVSGLPNAWAKTQHDIPIFHGKTVEDGKSGGGVGLWSPLVPGHGFGFDTDGVQNKYSDRFGPEITFALTMAETSPDNRVALIKFARGGTGLVDGVSAYGSWDPDYASGNRRNQYDNALTSIAIAMQTRDIDGDGREDRLIPAGIVWMQGEADAFDNLPAATHYADNLKRLMDLLRAALRADGLPVVIGQIADSGKTPDTRVMSYAGEVQQGQRDFVTSDPCAALVTNTQFFEFLPDKWHYTSDGYIELGTAFAESMLDLQKRCPAPQIDDSGP